MAFQDIVYEKSEHVALLKLNRPHKMNALTFASYQEVTTAILEAGKDDDVRVLVITGEGRGFCSGDDVQDVFLSGEDAYLSQIKSRIDDQMGVTHVGVDDLLFLDKPTIAAVNGAAVGYGMDIALMCDIRIASERARFGQVFVKRGLMGEEGGLIFLPRLVGWEKAAELIFTGDIIDAQEAQRIGLVSRIVPHEELLDAAMALARRIAANAPLAVRLSKQGLRRALGFDVQKLLEWIYSCQNLLFQSEDHREGALSFAEKRPAVFKGR